MNVTMYYKGGLERLAEFPQGTACLSPMGHDKDLSSSFHRTAGSNENSLSYAINFIGAISKNFNYFNHFGSTSN